MVIFIRRCWKCMGALLCAIVTNWLCLSFWTDYDATGFIRTLFDKKASVSIEYRGVLTGGNAFDISTEPHLNDQQWAVKRGLQRYTADLKIHRKWEKYTITLKVRRPGDIFIRLRGPEIRNDYGEISQVFVDYSNLKVCDKVIFSEIRKLSYEKQFTHRIPVKANDVIRVQFESRRHYVNLGDFNPGKRENLWYIVTLSIMSFAAFHVLLSKFSIFRRRGNAVDSIFLFLFFVLIAIPMSTVSDAQIAVREGRTLKQRPKMSSAFKGGVNYEKEYDEWFCDHLGGREWLIKLHDVIQRETQKIIRGRRAWYMQDSGWLFTKSGFTWHLGTELVQPVVIHLAKLEKFCEANHVKFYILVVPRKEDIYQEQLYGYGLDREKSSVEHTRWEQIRHLSARQHVDYIYPWAELRRASEQDHTFFKLTNHWTDWGAYIGYRALMKEVQRDFPKVPVVSLSDYEHERSNLIRDGFERSFTHGHLMLNFNFETDDRHTNTLYNYYDHKNAEGLVVKIGDFTKDFAYRGGGYIKQC